MPVIWDWEEDEADKNEYIEEINLEERFKLFLSLCQKQNDFENSHDKINSFWVRKMFDKEFRPKPVSKLSFLSIKRIAEENIDVSKAPTPVQYCKEYYIITKIDNVEMSYCREDCLNGLYTPSEEVKGLFPGLEKEIAEYVKALEEEYFRIGYFGV